jgi:surface antigen
VAVDPDEQTIRILRDFQNERGQPCRVVEQTVVISGQTVRATGTVCRGADGQWALSRDAESTRRY